MEQLLVRNENENNELVSNIFLGLSAIILLIWGLSLIGIFSVGFYTISTFAIIFVSLLLLPSVFIKLSKTRSPLVKYILIFDISLLTSLGYLFFTYQMVIMFILPVLISLLYMNKKLMWFSEGISLLFIVVIHLISAKFVAQPWLELFTDTTDIVRFNLLPRLIQLSACFVIINFLIHRVNDYFRQYDKIVSESRKDIFTNSGDRDLECSELAEALKLLTESEKKVFIELLHGKTNVQIAEELSFSMGTVKNYVSGIYDKLECRERNYLILKYCTDLKKYDQSHKKL